MPATALRCRVCETQYPVDPIGVCARCFGPLDPVYDRDEQRRTVTRESISSGPQSIWRYAQLLPVAPPPEQRLPVGWTPLVRAPRLAEAVGVGELWLKLDTANPTHSFKDRVVAVAAAKALELGRTTLAFEIAEQLGWELPDAVITPIASGAMFSKVHHGFGELLELGLVDGTTPRLVGGQAEGCSPVARAFADDAKLKPVRPNTVARSLAIGSPADGELAVSTARSSGGAVYAVAEDEIADNVALLAETTGIFGETAPGVTLGALREAVRRGDLGEDDRVVLLVTGDGLKTPSLVADRLEPTVVEPDADLILDSLSAAGGVR